MSSVTNIAWIARYAGVSAMLSILVSTPGYADEGRAAGGVNYSGSLKLSAGHIDNMYYSGDGEEVESDVWLLAPRLGVSLARGTGRYSLDYYGEVGEFDISSEDDYFDHTIEAKADIRPLTRHSFNISLKAEDQHDEYGFNRTLGDPVIADRELDQYRQGTFFLKYNYGSETGRLQPYLALRALDKNYYTNEDDTQFLDHQSLGGSAGLIYRWRPKVHFLGQVLVGQIEYDETIPGLPSFDGDFTQYLVGGQWEATAKTTGRILVGYFSREFDDVDRVELDGASWEVELGWTPKSYSRVFFRSGQSVKEQILQGENSINTEFYALGWRHNWTQRFYTEFEVEQFDYEFAGIGRDDDSLRFEAALGYQFYERYKVRLAFDSLDYDSSIPAVPSERNKIFLSIEASI